MASVHGWAADRPRRRFDITYRLGLSFFVAAVTLSVAPPAARALTPAAAGLSGERVEMPEFIRALEVGPEDLPLLATPWAPRSGGAGVPEGESAWEPREVRVLVLLVDFRNLPTFRFTADDVEERFFRAEGSLSDYYAEMSGGRVELRGRVFGPFTVPGRPRDYRVSPSELIRAAVEEAAAGGQVPFTSFDADLDGMLDALVVLHAGTSWQYTGSDEDLATHWASLVGPNREAIQEAAGIEVNDYTLASELGLDPDALDGIGPVAHELGHHFGLPDLYDKDESSAGIGLWGLMGYGMYGGRIRRGLLGTDLSSIDTSRPTGFTAWSKAQLGWIQVDEVTDHRTVVLDAIDRGRRAVAIPASPGSPTEFFLASLRRPVGFDADLPLPEDGGLLLWHVDWDPTLPKTNSHESGETCGLSYSRRAILSLEQADGRLEMERYFWSYGDAGDPFTGARRSDEFGLRTRPSSLDYDCNWAIEISDIRIKDGVAELDVDGRGEAVAAAPGCGTVAATLPAPPGRGGAPLLGLAALVGALAGRLARRRAPGGASS